MRVACTYESNTVVDLYGITGFIANWAVMDWNNNEINHASFT